MFTLSGKNKLVENSGLKSDFTTIVSNLKRFIKQAVLKNESV